MTSIEIDVSLPSDGELRPCADRPCDSAAARVCFLLVEGVRDKRAAKMAEALRDLLFIPSKFVMSDISPVWRDRGLVAVVSAIPAVASVLDRRPLDVEPALECAAGLVTLWGQAKGCSGYASDIVADWFDTALILAAELEIAAAKAAIHARGAPWVLGRQLETLSLGVAASSRH